MTATRVAVGDVMSDDDWSELPPAQGVILASMHIPEEDKAKRLQGLFLGLLGALAPGATSVRIRVLHGRDADYYSDK